MLLKNKTAVVTGATRGIGRAVLERFVEEGAQVLGIYRSSDRLAAELQQSMAAAAGNVTMLKGSIEDPAFVQHAMEKAYEAFGSIDVLVNNAGSADDALTMMMTEEQWQSVFSTNFQGTCHCCNACLPYMIKQGAGRMVNIVSVSGIYGRAGQLNYAASKGAIGGFSKLLARKYAAQGIHINMIAPGMVETDMTSAVSADKMENFLSHTHMKRQGTAREIADHVLFLSSAMSGYMSGTVLNVDGGFME